MGSITAIEKTRDAVAAIKLAAEAVAEPDLVTPSDAVAIYELLEKAVRIAGTAKTLLAKRVDASGEAVRRGFRSTPELLAKLSGSSLGAAKGELETSEALGDLPETSRAMLRGIVSPEQGKIVAGAASVNPEAEQRLLRKALTSNHTELREEAQRAKAAADPDLEATTRRIHRERRLSMWTDGEGAWNLKARGTVEDGAIIKAELERVQDRIFRERGKAGTTECRDAYAFDALRQVAEGSRAAHLGAASGASRQPAPQHLALLRLDVAALWRGYTAGDELCEITGLGPIPVASARRLLGDAVLKLVITNGVDVAHLTSLTRRPTQAMHYARLWTSPTCTVEGCSRTIVEMDHRTGAEYKDTRHTRLDELDPVCCGHHDLHTYKDLALVDGTGKRPMVPPEDPRHPLNRGPTATEVQTSALGALDGQPEAAHAASTASLF